MNKVYSYGDFHDKYNNLMLEASFKDLKAQSNKSHLVKKQHIQVEYKGIDKKGFIYFNVQSVSRPGKKHKFIMQLIDLEEAKKMNINGKPLNNREIMKLALYGDVKVYCSCESFKYHGFKYMAWVQGYGINKETRYPKIRNPQLQGTVCKHCCAVFNALPFYATTFIKDFKARKIL